MSVNRKYWFTTVLLSLFIIISGCDKTHIAKEKEQKTGSIVVESNNTNSSYTEEKDNANGSYNEDTSNINNHSPNKSTQEDETLSSTNEIDKTGQLYEDDGIAQSDKTNEADGEAESDKTSEEDGIDKSDETKDTDGADVTSNNQSHLLVINGLVRVQDVDEYTC